MTMIARDKVIDIFLHNGRVDKNFEQEMKKNLLAS